MSSTKSRLPLAIALTVAFGAALTGCSSAGEPGPERREAELLTQVSEPHAETGLTLLEGPTLDEDGGLYLVDVAAPAGAPKVLRIDLDSAEVETVYTDDTSAFTSAQFSPADGRLYLTDFVSGGVTSMTADGEDALQFFAGEVDGRMMAPDDLAFDEQGNLFVSDTTGLRDPAWQPQGRIVRIDHENARATVLADELPAPNGISFDPDFTGLWVSEYTGGRVDYMRLDESRTMVTTSHPAITFDGGTSQVDSNAVDAAGNVYQAVHGQPRIHVYSSTGTPLATIEVPEDDAAGLDSATNIAITPGGTDAYMTVSGSAGGFVYAFDALAEGIRQSNGG